MLDILTSPSPLTGLATLILAGATTQSTPAVPIKPGKLLSDRVLGYLPAGQAALPAAAERPRTVWPGSRRRSCIRSGADTTGAVQPARRGRTRR